MSYDTVVRLDKSNNIVIDECDIAYLDLAVHFECKENNYYKTFDLQQKYDQKLKRLDIDKSKSVQKFVLAIISRTNGLRGEFRKPWVRNLLLSQKKQRYTFLTHASFIRDVIKDVRKSPDKVTYINRFLKILHFLQYCYREDLQNELKTLFSFFICQLNVIRRSKQLGLLSKTIVEILKVFCVSDFMKILILCNPFNIFRILIRCSKRQKYNFCGIFENIEEESYPIAWTLMKYRLPHLQLLLVLGAKNLYSYKIHCQFYEAFFVCFKGYRRRVGRWIFNLLRYSKRNYLVMQVIHLYLIHLRNMSSHLPTQILMLLWKSISDPLLNQKELLCEWENKTAWAEEVLNDCWKWYDKNVISKETSIQIDYQSSPRCLKHLARCTIRKNLAANYLEPPYFSLIGEIPQELQKYLQMEL